MLRALRNHYPEYLMEAAGLGLFMISASLFTTLLEHPLSPLRQSLPNPLLRRGMMGVAMGMTAISIIYSPWGRRSGAHLNPAVTVTYFRLGKVEPLDAVFYVLFQFAGGILGVQAAFLALRGLLAAPEVNFAATHPGPSGAATAFLAETIISFLLMTGVLFASNHARTAPFTGILAGLLVATWILVEAPVSGMSMNPARTFGSAVGSGNWSHLWIYFAAPPLGMLLASAAYLAVRKPEGVYCAKLNHQGTSRCIFRCRFAQLALRREAAAPVRSAV